MTIDRTIYGINRNKPFTIGAGESYRFVNESDRTLYAMLTAADGGVVNVEVAAGRPIEINAGTGAIQVHIVALRPGY